MNANEYRVAVIIPTLNEEKFIIKCMCSVVSQTYPFQYIDLMVVDGGSQDKTCELVTKFAEEYPNIRLLENHHKIQSVAFNLGVQNSFAPYVIRLDAHVFYDVKYIELCMGYLNTNSQLGNVGGKWVIVSQEIGYIAEANAILNKVRFGIGGASFRVGDTSGYVDTVPFGAFPRRVIDEIGGMNEALTRGEDNDYNYRIRKAGYLIYFDPRIQCSYYARKSIADSVKQMYSNGYSIGQLLFINRCSISFRHLVPFFFVMSLFISFGASFFFTSYAFLGIIGLYFFVDIAASLIASIKYGLKYLILLPFLFFLIHVSYGFGTVKSVVEKINFLNR